MKNKKDLLILLMLIIGGIIGCFVRSGQKEDDRIFKVNLLMEQAIREVEVSIWETANAIYYYMTDPTLTSLKEYKKQLLDVEEYLKKYKILIHTEKEKKMVTQFEKVWADSILKSQELLKLREKMDKLQENAWDKIGDVDDIIDYKIQAAFVKGLPDLIKKERFVREVEVSIWEAINATNYYIHKQLDQPKRKFFSQLKDVDESWKSYKKLEITGHEKLLIKEFEVLWDSAVKAMKECHTLADLLRKKYLSYWKSVHEADDVIDFEIQAFLKKRLETD